MAIENVYYRDNHTMICCVGNGVSNVSSVSWPGSRQQPVASHYLSQPYVAFLQQLSQLTSSILAAEKQPQQPLARLQQPAISIQQLQQPHQLQPATFWHQWLVSLAEAGVFD